jgi:hypothetical protein
VSEPLAALSNFRDALRIPDALFDERIAQWYETLWPELFDPAVVHPTVSFLAELAGTGQALKDLMPVSVGLEG